MRYFRLFLKIIIFFEILFITFATSLAVAVTGIYTDIPLLLEKYDVMSKLKQFPIELNQLPFIASGIFLIISVIMIICNNERHGIIYDIIIALNISLMLLSLAAGIFSRMPII